VSPASVTAARGVQSGARAHLRPPRISFRSRPVPINSWAGTVSLGQEHGRAEVLGRLDKIHGVLGWDRVRATRELDLRLRWGGEGRGEAVVREALGMAPKGILK
jgi:hypothetical protein